MIRTLHFHRDCLWTLSDVCCQTMLKKRCTLLTNPPILIPPVDASLAAAKETCGRYCCPCVFNWTCRPPSPDMDTQTSGRSDLFEPLLSLSSLYTYLDRMLISKLHTAQMPYNSPGNSRQYVKVKTHDHLSTA